MQIEEAILTCDELVELIDEYSCSIHVNGQEFFEDVREKVVSMQESLTRMRDAGNAQASDAQVRALRNWEEGLKAWLYD